MANKCFLEKEASKSGRSIADNIAPGASALPAVNPLLTISAAPGSPVQRYVAGGGYAWPLTRTSDDGKMQVVGKTTGNKFYAEAALRQTASAALRNAGAAITLEQGAGIKSVKKPGTTQRNTLPEVEVRQAEDTGEDFVHEDSCITEALAIMNTTPRQALGAKSSGALYREVLNYVLRKRGLQDAENDAATIAGTENARVAGVDDLDSYEDFRDLLYKVVYKTDLDLEESWEYAKTQIAGNGHLTMEAFWPALKNLSLTRDRSKPGAITQTNVAKFEKIITNQLSTRDLLARHSPGQDEEVDDLNEKANPKIGGAFLIMSGGRNKEKQLTWNYHWGAAVMKSGADIVTIESYANTPDAVGIWDMYGTLNKEQTFHAEHAATDKHGESPVTVGTWIGRMGVLSAGSERDLAEENVPTTGTKKNAKKKKEG
jgi:hypothetical protein